jgi:pimeloyl-ACP methyl ester carboxylesterase
MTASHSMRFSVDRPGIHLEGVDYGGAGSPVVLLHGLAGTAREWTSTASWLTRTHRVFAPDQRGHGGSERRPDQVSCEAFVGDVLALIEQLELGRVSLVGQSFGGHTAFLVAARHPSVVRALVVAEASPAATPPETVTAVRDRLEAWPVPFSSLGDAKAFFGGETLAARAWSDGLEEREGALWPPFDVEVMVAALSATVGTNYWEDWAQIEAPTLIVRAGQGELRESEAREMLARLPGATLVEIAGAGHDVHLEAPIEWRKTVAPFLASLS